MAKSKKRRKSPEIPLVGDVDRWEEDVLKTLLDLPEGGECVFYIDSSGGSVYGALAVAALLRHRKLNATAVVLGECSSACIMIFAACKKRLVTRHSTFLFHRMRWQSDKRVGSGEATLWARHFEDMEKELDAMQERLLGAGIDEVRQWIAAGQYVTGAQIVAAGLAELIEI
ncbi:MAG: ATP-dependent Clp protease proteolytic subunit [Gemmataceae bacterium]|nr:ATP-dependent Clp protease proteolytic subunit [Gemmataceae bacterium]